MAITRLRLGHTGLNSTLRWRGKPPTGRCRECDQPETVQHVMMEWKKCQKQRKDLTAALHRSKENAPIENLLKPSGRAAGSLVRYLRETEFMDRVSKGFYLFLSTAN